MEELLSQSDIETIRDAAMVLAGFNHGKLSHDLTLIAQRMQKPRQSED